MAPNKLQIGDPNIFETMAFCNYSEEYVNVNNAGSLFFRLDIYGAAVSTIALLVVALVMLSDEKLGAHPNKMIAYVFLCDAYLYF